MNFIGKTLLATLLSLSAAAAHASAFVLTPPITVESGSVSFSGPSSLDTLTYSVTTPSAGGIYDYSFTVSGTDVSNLSQIAIPLLNGSSASSLQGSVVNFTPGTFWNYNGGTTSNGKSAFNSANISSMLVLNNFTSSTSITLDFTSPYAPVNGVYQLGYVDQFPLYIDPPTPGAGSVPEPGPLLLLASGLAIMAGMQKSRTREKR